MTGSPDHLAPGEISRLADRLLQAETAVLHLHVLRCSACRAALLAHLPPVAHRADVYEEVLDRSEAAASDLADQALLERREAPVLWEELQGLPVAERRERIATSPRYQTVALADLLAARGEAARARDLSFSEESLLLALSIADHLPAQAGRQMAADDLRARLHTGLGETWRRAGRLEMAEEAFSQVSRFLRGLPLLDSNARFCWLLGRLRLDQERRDEAEALYRRAAALYSELGHPKSAGRVQADLGLRCLGLGEEEIVRDVLEGIRTAGSAAGGEHLVRSLAEGGFEPAIVHEIVERLTEPLLQRQG